MTLVADGGCQEDMDGEFDDCCILFWNGGHKTVPFSTLTKVPTFFMAPSLCKYQKFAALYEAREAPFFQRETVLQVPGGTILRENTEITPLKRIYTTATGKG
jgi:hypothetical protein